jgi:uncharacterized repeat protein (TIGR01451 family)
VNTAKPDAAASPQRSDPCHQTSSNVQQSLVPVPDLAAQPAPAAPAPAVPESTTPQPAPLSPGIDTVATALGAQTPTLYLEKIGPASISLGKPLVYTIVVRTGSVAAANVRLEDRIPPQARFVNAEPQPDNRGEHPVWSLGNLEPGAERRIKVELQPIGEGDLLTCATVTFSGSSALKTHVTQPRLAVTASGPENALVGDPVVFHLQVTNTGTGTATGVVLHDDLPSGLKHEQGSRLDADIGTLQPGESKKVTLQATAAHAGPQINEVLATSSEGLRATAHATVLLTEASLTIQKSGPERRFLNREAEFVLEVVNTGTAAATNVQLIDSLPPGMEVVGASEGGRYDAAARTVSWKIGNLDAGKKQDVAVRVLAKAVGDLVNLATVQADRGLEAKVPVPLHVEGIPALRLEVVDLEDPIAVGSETTYEIRVLNQGSCDCTNLQISATVPTGMTPRGAAAASGHRIQGQQVVFEPLPRLAPHADMIYRVKVAGQQPGDMRFKVQMTADQLSQPVNKEESTRVYSDQ